MHWLLMQTLLGGYFLLNFIRCSFFMGEENIQELLVEDSPDDQFCFHWNKQNFGNRWQITFFFFFFLVKQFHKNKLCHFCKTAN